MDQIIDYLKSVTLVDAVGIVLVCVIVVLCAQLFGRLMGKRRMKKRARLTQEVREIIEDHFVDGLTEAIYSKRMSIEEARELYAKIAHWGFWGLHPRKFVPKKTPEELEELKEKLKARRAAREKANRSFDDMLEAMATELKGA